MSEVAQALHVDSQEVQLAIDKLLKASRLELCQITEEDDETVDKQARYNANNCYLPVGETLAGRLRFMTTFKRWPRPYQTS